MNMRSRVLAVSLLTATALPLAACGGGSDAPKISFAAAMKSQDAATQECKKLIGDDGAKLNALGDRVKTGTVVGYRENDESDGRYFTCKAHGGPELFVMRDSEVMEDQLTEISMEATEDPSQRSWMTQSAQNKKNSMGVVLTYIAMSKKDDAPKQLQAWTKQLDK